MRRRDFVGVLCGAAVAWPFPARAALASEASGQRGDSKVQPQPKPRMLRVGYVGIQPRDAPLYATFRQRMAELGYREGRNFTFEHIQTPDIEGYAPAYRELAARKIDVFLAVGSEPALRAALAAAGTLPIAFLALDFDPTAKGYVASLTRPGGNVTGILVQQIELAAKRIELLREVLPDARRVGLFRDASSRDQVDAAAEAAQTLGFVPLLLEVSGQRPDYAMVLGRLGDAPGQAVVVPAGPVFMRDRVAIARALTQARLPSIAAFREMAEAGTMMSYGVDLAGLFRDMGVYVDRIAKGGRPSDMPIEQTTRFHLTSLGVSLSNAFAARADEVIE